MVIIPYLQLLEAISFLYGAIIEQINTHFFVKTLKSVPLSFTMPFVGHGVKV